MQMTTVRDYSRHGDALPVPNLIEVQAKAYERFLQQDKPHDQRDTAIGLEALLREVFPIVSYDESMQLEYLYYRLEEPRYTPDECRELKLTYGFPFKVGVRLVRKDVAEIPEEEIYLGEIPVLMGGGEYIVNGAERVIVNQLHRSPGVDFSIASSEADRPLHSARIIPERGSWIELEVTKKDVLTMRIDQSTKIPATTFLRALSLKLVERADQAAEAGDEAKAAELRKTAQSFSTTDGLIRLFYDVVDLDVKELKPEYYVAGDIIDTDTGEVVVSAGHMIGTNIDKVIASPLKTVAVIQDASDMLVLNTIAEEKQARLEGLDVSEFEASLLYLYLRLRPGNPPQVDKAKALFVERFFDENRYRLGRVGRFRINRKFDLDVPEEEMQLGCEDFAQVVKYILDLRSQRNKAHIDDIDHLGNRRLRTLDELAVEEVRKGFLKLRRTVQERMSVKDPSELAKVADLINSKSISSAIEHFFGRSELSQVVDQTNPLSQVKHERTLSAMGPGGLNRKRAGFEVRDVHISHYGRVCPIETPEGQNIGLICSLGIYSQIDEYGFLRTPYRVVKDGKVTSEVVYLRADEEMKITLAPCDTVGPDGRLNDGLLLARVDGELTQTTAKQVDYVDISPKQIVGVSAAMIPFLEHDDANRALMGSNMQRQAVPLIKTQPPCVATGMEKEVPKNSGMVVLARNGGTVTYVDAQRIIIDNADEYELRKFAGLNEKTCLNQKPIVKLGAKVKPGQIIADGPACLNGELALGKNVMVAFNTFDGYNFEDAIVINEKLVRDDTFTSIHIEEFDVEIRDTKLGREEFTRDIPNVSERMLAKLDEAGIIQIGSYVKPGDILVGKVSPKSKSELSPEEKLLHAIFGRAGEDVKNDSLEVPAGTEGIVIGAKRFSRRMHLSDEQKRQLKKDMRDYEQSMDDRTAELFRQMIEQINEVTGTQMVDPSTRQKVGVSDLTEVLIEQVEDFNLKWVKGNKESRTQAEVIYNQFWPRIEALRKEKERKSAHMKRGDELQSGVLEMVKIYLATKRALSVGDKMAGRHGNKGVIARIVPEEDMPFLEDGTSVEILLNPLGVPSRMNVGQILETHLGWACGVLGFQAVTPVFDGASEQQIAEVIEEANQYVRRRRRQLLNQPDVGDSALSDLIRSMPKVPTQASGRTKIKSQIESLLDIGYSQYLREVNVAVADADVSTEAIHAVEKLLIASYRPEFNGTVETKLSISQLEEAVNELGGSEYLKLCREVIESTDGWSPCFTQALRKKYIADLAKGNRGLYFFRKSAADGIKSGYIGLAAVGKPDSSDLRYRLKDHFVDDSGQDNFPNKFLDRLTKLTGSDFTSEPLEGPVGPARPDELLTEMPKSWKIQLYDGRTGEPFDQRTTVGHMYMLKLHHLVDEKIHARATGPYSLITQQPLGGKARTGGQRFGEMEVWALEAYGAAYILQELLTVKSDDVEGRTKIYESMVKGNNTLQAGMPVAFDVLCNEIKGLGMNITLEKASIEGSSLL